MDSKLMEILKKAKEVDSRAKKFDKTDTSVLESNINERAKVQINNEPPTQVLESKPTPQPTINPNDPNYKQKVKESKLPPEIQRLMLENPITPPDTPGTFSMDEEMIREINPSYGQQKQTVVEEEYIEPVVSRGVSSGINESDIRRMIAEEISKALPSIVEKYFDKKMIQENINLLKSIKVRRKTQ